MFKKCEHGRLNTILEARNFLTMNEAITKYIQCSTEMTGSTNTILYAQRGQTQRGSFNNRSNYRGRDNGRGYYNNNCSRNNGQNNNNYNNNNNHTGNKKGNYRGNNMMTALKLDQII